LATLPVPIVFNLLPHFDIGREEARRIQTLHETGRIAAEIGANSVEALQPIAAQKDIRGNSCRVEVMPAGYYRVSTPGINGVYDSPDAVDADDIHSEMKSAPTEVFQCDRRRQWIIAFAVWGLCSAGLFLVFHRRAL
jgi:hypothetical protein